MEVIYFVQKAVRKYTLIAQMLYFFSISWPNYGGEDGLSIYMRNSLPMLNTMNPLTFYLISLSWLLTSIYISYKLINSPFFSNSLIFCLHVSVVTVIYLTIMHVAIMFVVERYYIMFNTFIG